MRLFGKVNSAMDRFDFAGWILSPFDRPIITVITSRTFYPVKYSKEYNRLQK